MKRLEMLRAERVLRTSVPSYSLLEAPLVSAVDGLDDDLFSCWGLEIRIKTRYTTDLLSLIGPS